MSNVDGIFFQHFRVDIAKATLDGWAEDVVFLDMSGGVRLVVSNLCDHVWDSIADELDSYYVS